MGGPKLDTFSFLAMAFAAAYMIPVIKDWHLFVQQHQEMKECKTLPFILNKHPAGSDKDYSK